MPGWSFILMRWTGVRCWIAFARWSRARACRREAPAIAAARERGLPVLGELELAWRLLENEFVAVTGTNGKTTTVELIGHIHRGRVCRSSSRATSARR